ncbi:hypothetical protein RND71_026169 [Anisodus tanguticus]|uniref:Uncharacterized protein n=1 Tax=Anisodus tanguticus TaxID=243964 RepID=A0AAE1RKE4_9SOLA|nr:hypothetical protein RND71_026169 [Anisodus tanguticus]
MELASAQSQAFSLHIFYQAPACVVDTFLADKAGTSYNLRNMKTMPRTSFCNSQCRTSTFAVVNIPSTTTSAPATMLPAIFVNSLMIGIWADTAREPIRVTLERHPMKNSFIFLDDPSGDRINAVITLKEADMLVFQSNKELLEFSSTIVQSSE